MTAHEPAGDPAPVRSPGELFDLTGQVAIVTGASSGLGRRFGRVLHASGAHVVLAARREDRLVDLAAELNGLPGNARAVAQACDVSDEVATRALVDRAVAEFGTVDVVVNNAGVGDGKRAIDETNDRVRAMLEVNLVGLFTLSRQAATVMLANGEGSIINIASVLGLVASAPVQQAAYCAAKGGVVNLTRQLGAEWGRKGVRVNAIARMVPFRDDRRNHVRRPCSHGLRAPRDPDGARRRGRRTRWRPVVPRLGRLPFRHGHHPAGRRGLDGALTLRSAATAACDRVSSVLLAV